MAAEALPIIRNDAMDFIDHDSIRVDAAITDYLFYNPNIGVDQYHSMGLPGSGKSNMSNGIAFQCMKNEKLDEKFLIPGDRFCEWRHFPYHPKWRNKWKVKVLVPEGVDIFKHQFPEEKKFKLIKENYSNITDELMDHLMDETKLLVIYDQHLEMGDRVALWAEIGETLLNRIEYIDKAIGMLFHEAGIYFPQLAKDKHWTSINDFSKHFVEFRKGMVRCMLLSQIKTEIESTLRGKCIFRVFRKGWVGKSEHPSISKATPFLKINQFISSRGGLFIGGNTVNKFKEHETLFKMIPPKRKAKLVSQNSSDNQYIPPLEDSSQNKTITHLRCFHCGYSWFPRVDNPVSCPNCKYRVKGLVKNESGN